MAKNYIGVTIGPIIKTLTSAKETGQLWGGSYIFSYLMKNFIKKVKEKDLAEEFIIPYVGDEIFDEHLGAGLFPDRFIFSPKEDKEVFKELEIIQKDILDNMADKIAEKLDESEEKLREYVSNYFIIYYLEKEIKNDDNVILNLSPYLDALELQQKIVAKEDKNYLLRFLRNNKVKNSTLTEDAFGKPAEIDSTFEIAVSDLGLSEDTIERCKEEEDFYAFLDNIQQYHKYIAIVQADGDNVGQIIEELDQGEYQDFSEKLFNYASGAVKQVKEYGGYPVYAGGDDLLFFAPVVNNDRNIFDLLNKLSEKFDKIFKDPQASLSFGVTMVYYKYPLYEALDKTINLLFQKAKNFELGNKKKNAISFRVIKHSGQIFGTELNKESDSYKQFLDLLEQDLEEGKFLSSLQYRIKQDEDIIKESIKKDSLKDLEGYFDNNFKKEVHLDNDFIDEVKDLTLKTYQDLKDNDLDFIDVVHYYLRFIKFIMAEES